MSKRLINLTILFLFGVVLPFGFIKLLGYTFQFDFRMFYMILPIAVFIHGAGFYSAKYVIDGEI